MFLKEIILELSNQFSIPVEEFEEAIDICKNSFIKSETVKEAHNDYVNCPERSLGRVHALVRMLELKSENI